MGSRESRIDRSTNGPTQVSHSPPQETVFRKEGQYWTIVYQDSVLRLRDTKGLRYIAQLLRHPGIRFAASQLMQEPTGGEIPASADAPATSSPNSTTNERARLGVTKRIKATVKIIEAHHPALGYHLSTAVKTGAYCVYSPDPGRPIVWRS